MSGEALLWIVITSADENAWKGALSTFGLIWDYVETDRYGVPTSNIFKSPKGKLQVQGGRTLLLNTSGKQVGTLEGIDATKDQPVGKNGSGRSDESGIAINWIVQRFLIEAKEKPTTEMMLQELRRA